MKIEDRLRKELHDTAEHLVIRPHDFERAVRIGKRRHRIATISGAAASVAVLAGVVVLALLPPTPVNPLATVSTSAIPPPSTTMAPESVNPLATASTSAIPPPSTTMAPESVIPSPTGLAVAGRDGITLHDFASGESRTLVSDQWYEPISWVISDGAGGIVFVHEVTPLPWDQGSIMWLPAGATEPQPLIAPGVGELMVPLDVVDGTRTLLYRYDHAGGSELRTLDLSAPSSQPLLDTGDLLLDAAVDGDILAVVYGGDCGRVEFYSMSRGGAIDVGSTQNGCLPAIDAVGMAGGFLYTIEDSGGDRQLVVRHLATGETVDSVPIGDAWDLQVAPDGTVAYGGTTVAVGRFSEGSFDRLYELPNAGTFALTEQLSLSSDATLGSGSGQLPCTPADLSPLPDQGLPPEVTATRDAIFAAAAACDLETLAELVPINQTNLWFGSPEEPIRTWVRSARNGLDAMAWMVRILNTDPAFSDSESGPYYAWPAVYLTRSEEDWQALSGVFSAAEYEQLYAYRDSGYMGFRIGIGADGRWWFAIPGGD